MNKVVAHIRVCVRWSKALCVEPVHYWKHTGVWVCVCVCVCVCMCVWKSWLYFLCVFNKENKILLLRMVQWKIPDMKYRVLTPIFLSRIQQAALSGTRDEIYCRWEYYMKRRERLYIYSRDYETRGRLYVAFLWAVTPCNLVSANFRDWSANIFSETEWTNEEGGNKLLRNENA